jgi:hypothetical protein
MFSFKLILSLQTAQSLVPNGKDLPAILFKSIFLLLLLLPFVLALLISAIVAVLAAVLGDALVVKAQPLWCT